MREFDPPSSPSSPSPQRHSSEFWYTLGVHFGRGLLPLLFFGAVWLLLQAACPAAAVGSAQSSTEAILTHEGVELKTGPTDDLRFCLNPSVYVVALRQLQGDVYAWGFIHEDANPYPADHRVFLAVDEGAERDWSWRPFTVSEPECFQLTVTNGDAHIYEMRVRRPAW